MPEMVVRVSAADGSARETRTDSAGPLRHNNCSRRIRGATDCRNRSADLSKPVDVKVLDQRIVDVVLHVDTGIR